MPETAKSTESLIREWQSGRNRDEAFRYLVDRYYRPLIYFFRKRGVSPEDTRDLAQETFLGVYRGMGNLRHGSKFEAWLFAIAANVWRSRLRSRRSARRDESELSLQGTVFSGEAPVSSEVGDDGDDKGDMQPLVSHDDQGPLHEILDQERTKLLRDSLNDLPSQMRACVELRLVQNLKYREIAAVMGISIQTVKSHLHQARSRLRAALADRYSDIDTK